jgi:hypothetical protein
VVSFALTPSLETAIPKTAVDLTKIQEISDICKELQDIQCRADHCCIGFIEDAEARHLLYPILPSAYPKVSPAPVSLRNLLTSSQTGKRPPILLRTRDKYELAIILATSVLQLNCTPWLKDRWSSDDILFLPRQGENCPATYAYIRKTFASSSIQRSTTIPLEPRPSVRSEATFALGIVLLELSLGADLESFFEPSDLGPRGERTILSDFTVARRLISEIHRNEGLRYATVVSNCIYGAFPGLGADLETDQDFRRGFYQQTVVVLKDILNDFTR